MGDLWKTDKMRDMKQYILEEVTKRIDDELFRLRDEGDIAVHVNFDGSFKIYRVENLQRACLHKRAWDGTGKCANCHKKVARRRLKKCDGSHRWEKDSSIDFEGNFLPATFAMCKQCGLGIPPTVLSPYRTQFFVPEMPCTCSKLNLKRGQEIPTTADGLHCYVCKGRRK